MDSFLFLCSVRDEAKDFFGVCGVGVVARRCGFSKMRTIGCARCLLDLVLVPGKPFWSRASETSENPGILPAWPTKDIIRFAGIHTYKE
jgi:hypothetical protein